MARELTLDKGKILSQLKALQSVSNGWTLDYDSEVDQLFYGLQKVPKGYFLFQVNDEISLFVNKNSRVSGMFIEYFKDNFLEHNKELQPVLAVLEDKDNSSSEIQEIERIALEKDLFFDAYTSLHNRGDLVTAIA